MTEFQYRSSSTPAIQVRRGEEMSDGLLFMAKEDLGWRALRRELELSIEWIVEMAEIIAKSVPGG